MAFEPAWRASNWGHPDAMLLLVFQIGRDRYALEARQAVEVVPFLALKRIPQAPRGIAGIFNYRGRPVPAIDLSELTLGRSSSERLSTRIIVLRFEHPEEPAHVRLLGLIAERTTGLMRYDEREFVDSGVGAGGTPYLGPVLVDDKGVIQLLRTQHLLTEGVRDLLFGAPARVQP